MKDIFTVTLSFDGDVSSVSFLNFEDAVNYAIDEVLNINGVPYDEDELRDIFNDDRYLQIWPDSDDFISIDDAKLCDSYKRGSL